MEYAMNLILGDSIEKLKELKENSVDACITDPPYELGFMGKSWDNTGIAYRKDLWLEVLRVLKPGGHLLSFGGSRTYHRMACAIEDAGFEIRDQIMWVYGSGFPKSLNIGKAVDKLQGNERNIVGQDQSGSERNCMAGDFTGGKYDLTKGTSEWEGWGTALKPAHEPIVLARKPLSEKTVAENCLKWGVGGLAIDNCRVGYISEKDKVEGQSARLSERHGNNQVQVSGDRSQRSHITGRFPANLILDGSDEVVDLFPNTKAGVAVRHNSGGNTFGGENKKPPMDDIGYADNGSASRFFYCAKASKKERNMGCGGLEEKHNPHGSHVGRDLTNPKVHLGGLQGGKARNNHPTVKPLALMKYLVTLITREGQTVLDPFLGSGTTGIAAKELKRDFIGIELSEEYMEIAKARICNNS